MAFHRAGEAQIDDFEIEVFVEKYVFDFEVSVGDAFGVHVVDRLEQLSEVVLADGGRQGTLRGRDVAE